MNNSNDLVYMRNYLQYAFEFEKYVAIWQNSMTKANQKLQMTEQERRESIQRIQTAQYTINTLDQTYDRRELQEVRKLKMIRRAAIILPSAFIIFLLAALLFLRTFEEDLLTSLAAIVIAAMPCIVPILIAEAILIHKRSSSAYKIKNYGSQKRQDKELEALAIQENESNLNKLTDIERNIKLSQQQIFENLQSAQKTLNVIYSENILPVKYRNLIAAGTLLEYIQTGRCTQIKGHGGIYDTYEADLKAGIIISELREIKQYAKQTLEYQKRLLNEVQQIKTHVINIERTLDKINDNLTEINRNTAITAVASSQSAAANQYMATVAYLRGV